MAAAMQYTIRRDHVAAAGAGLLPVVRGEHVGVLISSVLYRPIVDSISALSSIPDGADRGVDPGLDQGGGTSRGYLLSVGGCLIR